MDFAKSLASTHLLELEMSNVPKLRFKEFSGDWEEKKLGEVSVLTSSKRVYLSDYTTFGIPFYRGKEISEIKLGIVPKDILYISQEAYDEYKSKFGVPHIGDILITAVGTLGNVLRINDNSPFYFKDGNLIWIKDIQENSAFLERLLEVNSEDINKTSIGSTQRALTMVELRKLKFIFPSKQEQEKIASFLTAVDNKIEKLTKKESLLQQYKKGVMQKLFSQELRFKDDNGKEFPEWEEKKLGDIGTFQTSSIDKLSRDSEENVFLVNYMNVYKHEKINQDTIKTFQLVTAKDNQIKTCNLKKGDILFTPSSETPDDIGHSVVIFEDLENAVFSYHLMRFRPKISIDILYSHYFCNIPSILNQLSKLATGSTRFTISIKSFSSVIVQLPCIEEQTKIANFLSTIDKKIEMISKEIEKAKEFKKGLLQQMFV